MQLTIASFDDLIQRGVPYFPPSKSPNSRLTIAENMYVEDTPDDFVILEKALLTSRCGLGWKGLWLAPAIQYMPPTWQQAEWLPGKVGAVGLTITIPYSELAPK